MQKLYCSRVLQQQHFVLLRHAGSGSPVRFVTFLTRTVYWQFIFWFPFPTIRPFLVCPYALPRWFLFATPLLVHYSLRSFILFWFAFGSLVWLLIGIVTSFLPFIITLFGCLVGYYPTFLHLLFSIPCIVCTHFTRLPSHHTPVLGSLVGYRVRALRYSSC